MGTASTKDIRVARLVTTRVATVDVQADALSALRLLVSEPTPCVIVCREGTPVGVVTLRDLGVACAVHWPDLSRMQLRVEQIMSSPLIEVSPDAKLTDLIPVLSSAEIECLTVMSQGKLVGVLERGKVLRACLRMLVP